MGHLDRPNSLEFVLQVVGRESLEMKSKQDENVHAECVRGSRLSVCPCRWCVQDGPLCSLLIKDTRADTWRSEGEATSHRGRVCSVMDILAEALRWGLRGGPKGWRDLNSGRNRGSKARITLGLAAHWKDWLLPPEWDGEPLGDLGPTMKSSDTSNGELWLLCLKKTSELPKSNKNTGSHLWF